ncbi:MAG: sulfite exporter TauE/SafE family protein [Sulfuricella sp.]|nr:sulfite exporter TauE/SafE family protein [Sulfuricella sp.]
MDWIYTLAGFGVGVIVGLTGVGGGALMTPLLVLGFGISPTVAVGTDLLYAGLTKSGGVWVHSRHNTVQWKIAGWLAAGSLPATLVVLGLLRWFPIDKSVISTLITGTLGFTLILTALALLFKDRLRAWSPWSRNRGAVSVENKPPRRVAVTIATGAVIGVLVTLTSVGAGALGAAALFFLYPRLSAVQIVGTDLAHAVPLALLGGVGHWLLLGTVDGLLLASLLLGSLPGIWLGSHLGISIPEKILRPVLACMLMLIGGKLVL